VSAAAPTPGENQGAPLPRIDARLKVTGEARYAADIPVANLAYAVLVTSEIARGSVSALDLADARRTPGVLLILSYGDVAELARPKFGMGSYTSLAPLHERRIWHDGQIMAMVVAESFQAAEEAANKVSATYASEPPSAEMDSPGTEELAAAGKVAMLKKDPQAGDFAAAWQGAAVKLEAEYATPTQTHNPIELFSTTAVWSGDDLTVYEPTQAVFGFRGEIAKQLQIAPSRVRVVSPYVGGGFGSKGPITPRTAIVALAARRLNRPVRCVVSRAQGFTTQPYRAPTRHRIRLAATAQGQLTGFSHDSWELTSRLDNYAVAGTETTTRMYGYGAVASKVRIVKADRQTPSFMRSPPELPYMFALESAMDELAWQLRIDPVALRLRNDIQHEPIEGKPFSSRHLKECFEQGAAAFGWSARQAQPASMRAGEWLVGMGCAAAVYPTNIGAAAARVRLGADGQVRVQSASHEIGTGVRTVAGQMAAERLGVELDAVRVETGDTNLPPAPVSGGSNSTASVCSVVLKACDQIRARLFAAVTARGSGPLVGRDPATLTLRSGTVVGRDGNSVALRNAFDALGAGVIEEYAEHVPAGAPADAMQKLYQGQSSLVRGEQEAAVAFAFGAEFVEVHVHARTREIRVPRMLGAFAAGRIMNTRTARSQLMGGMIWGVSAALLEVTELDVRSARTLNRDLQDYLVPVNADVGEVGIIMLPEVDQHINPAGVKGIGELGNVGTNAAVANAVFHATGVRLRTLPIRLEHLLELPLSAET
jgi:xanthine dehydrogenase YagR molybdenum-binding subunit